MADATGRRPTWETVRRLSLPLSFADAIPNARARNLAYNE